MFLCERSWSPSSSQNYLGCKFPSVLQKALPLVNLFSGGFDGTSNVLAGKLFNIPVKGTHAHAYITSFSNLDDLGMKMIPHGETKVPYNLSEMAVNWREKISHLIDISPEEASDGELAALISYAIAFPNGFIALVDTYDVKRYPINGTALQQCTVPHHNTDHKTRRSSLFKCDCQKINFYSYATELMDRTLR